MVEQVQHEILEKPITVYNFEVADFHTYYVGDTEVLVHNDCDNYNYGGAKNQANATKRGWNDRMINEAIANGKKGSSINMANNELCSVYTYPGRPDQYVVIENSSRNIVQFSDFSDWGWKPDPRIVWDP